MQTSGQEYQRPPGADEGPHPGPEADDSRGSPSLVGPDQRHLFEVVVGERLAPDQGETIP